MFLFKKFLGGLLMPLPLALALLFAALILLWFTRRQRVGKALATAALLLLFFASSRWMAWWVSRPLTFRYPPWRVAARQPAAPPRLAPNAGVQIALPARIVVLGGGAVPNRNLPLVARLSPASLDRLIEGIRVYRALSSGNANERLVLSGGSIWGTPEAALMARLAHDLGIPRAGMRLDTRSRDTEDEARDLQPLLGAQPFLLVTSAVHLPRAMALFEKRGLHPIPVPADGAAAHGPGGWHDLIPAADDLVDTTAAWHEMLGRWWGDLRGETQ